MKISTAFPSVKSLPDPANVVTPAQWYILSHLSSPLIQYDHIEGRFNPLLAESWEIDGNNYRFHIRPDAVFNDGKPITAHDVAASIKRLILKKTSTHFQLWTYFADCAHLKSVDEPCLGIKVIDEKTIEFRLIKRLESFFLFLASPEGAVWCSDDIAVSSGDLQQKRFSGPYQVTHIDTTKLSLKRNEYSPITKSFPKSPNEIEIYINGQEPVELFSKKLIDVYIEMNRPFYETTYNSLGLNRTTSSFNTIIYLFKVGDSQKQVPSNFIEELWSHDLGKEMVPADTFLPFGSLGALNRESFLKALPSNVHSQVRVAVPSPFFHDKMIQLLNETAKKSQADLIFEPVSVSEAYALYEKNPSNPGHFDFVLTPYVASERFPSVQITFLLEGRELPIKLTNLDSPDSSIERRDELRAAQTWMLSNQLVVPLVFVRNHVLSVDGVDLGEQPITDSEIQFWRVTKQ